MTWDEIVAYYAQHCGEAPPLIADIAQRMADGVHQYGLPYADVVLAHCMQALKLSVADQAWILYQWAKIMMRHP